VGSVVIWTSSTGASFDVDGFQLKIDDGPYNGHLDVGDPTILELGSGGTPWR
jgi:hypothetical protein